MDELDDGPRAYRRIMGDESFYDRVMADVARSRRELVPGHDFDIDGQPWQPCKPGCIHLEPHAISECQTAAQFRRSMAPATCQVENVAGTSRCEHTPDYLLQARGGRLVFVCHWCLDHSLRMLKSREPVQVWTVD